MSPRRFILAAALACLPPAEGLAAEPVVFATAGPTGEFRTVQAAIDALPASGAASRVIRIQPGAYFGRTVLNKARVMLRGSGPDTLLTCNLGQAMPGENGQPVGWQGAAALRITPEAEDAVIENLTIENTYGRGMQAQACVVEADRVVFRRCRILGWQDTLRLEAGRQWFDRCYIAGHVDFIYGGATAFFENCEIHCRDSGYIVAPATPAGRTGFIFADCRITFPYGDPPTYLGRPWHESPSATFIRCELGAGIRPEGWHEWRVQPPLVRFAEYESRGPGANPEARVPWATTSAGSASASFNRSAVLGDWNPPP
jgi:pectinesterase